MALIPTGTAAPAAKSDPALAQALRAKLQLAHVQLMSNVRPGPQRMVDLLNTYLNAVRGLHGDVVTPKVAVVHKGSEGTSVGITDSCFTPSPAGPIPVPYPNVTSSSTTKTDPGQQQKRSKLEGMHLQIMYSHFSASHGDEAGTLRGVVTAYMKGVCEFVLYASNVKVEGKTVDRTGSVTMHNRRP